MKNKLLLIPVILFLFSCDEPYLKPKGYPLIEIPASEFVPFESCFFTTERPASTVVETKIANAANPCWFNLSYPELNGKVHFTYLKVQDNLEELIDHSYKIKNNHLQVASNIPETVIDFPEHHVGGILFEIQGVKTASPLNFFVTDSTNHFLTGSLYFNHSPNNDSIAPLINHITLDLNHFLKNLKWKE